MKRESGFTLIELLAVIIILGVLMIIAVPAVTKYISESRKNSYVSTAKSITNGVRTLANSGTLGMDDKNTTYYIPAGYIKTENGLKSPYGDITEAYVGVIVFDDSYSYYWISRDETGTGIKNITPIEDIEADDIENEIAANSVINKVRTTGIGNRQYIKILSLDGTWESITLPDTSNNISENGKLASSLVCMKATTLHQKTCQKTGSGCGATVGEGSQITYGTISSGTPKIGDAYDCDVNDDGIFDSTSERFYYIGSDGANSSLIYYANYGNTSNLAYDSSNENWNGPVTGYLQLPSISEWSNSKLIVPGTRQIKNELGGNTTDGGTIGEFTYTGRAARLLTYQELRNICDVPTMIDVSYPGYLDTCSYLLENTLFDGGTSMAYWLESPNSTRDDYVWFILTDMRLLSSGSTYTTINGYRPVITVRTNEIER